jgi:hypothetical protein
MASGEHTSALAPHGTPAARGHDDVNCGNCEFSKRRHEEAALAAQSARAGHTVAPLHCLRDPTPVLKHPHERCAGHSALLAFRADELAEKIAVAVVSSCTKTVDRCRSSARRRCGRRGEKGNGTHKREAGVRRLRRAGEHGQERPGLLRSAPRGAHAGTADRHM